MKNLNSVFAAYLIAWGIFFVYYVTVAQRASQLQKDLERLKGLLNRKK
jgi:CcmD family protein